MQLTATCTCVMSYGMASLCVCVHVVDRVTCLELPHFRAKHTLPDLPYDYNDLSPVISSEIMTLHHSKHHQTYVNGLNAAEEQYVHLMRPSSYPHRASRSCSMVYMSSCFGCCVVFLNSTSAVCFFIDCCCSSMMYPYLTLPSPVSRTLTVPPMH